MGEIILQTHQLSKKYGSSYVLRDISLTVERGWIYGLAGKSGAGKTILVRLICGQSRPESGSLELFGESPDSSRDVRTRIGCMTGKPAFYPYLSARRNLRLYLTKKGLPDAGRIDELLDLVGIAEAADSKFSLLPAGMKMRLGLALALMSSPELLVLDDPMNGLDPIDIFMMRRLILKLNRERGVTMLISSHHLKELANVATHFGFIDRGIMVKELAAGELYAQCKSALYIRVDNTEKACAVLENICGCKSYRILPENIIRCYDQTDQPELINRELIENGINVYSLVPDETDLEQYFIELLGGDDAD